MKDRTLLLVGVIAIILVISGIWCIKTNKCPFLILPSPSPSPESTPVNLLPMAIKSISESDNFFNIRVEYPQFNTVDPAFNEKITKLIETSILDFKKESKDNWEAIKATAPKESPLPENPTEPFDFQVSWNPVQINDKYLSFVIDIFYYTGGASGNEEIHAFNYDIANKKEIAIIDFLNSSQESLQKLSQLAIQDIDYQLQSRGVEVDDSLKQMIEQGAGPNPENYKNFNFKYNALFVYFQRYQVAPGSFGSITMSFYKSDLETNSIKSDYLK